MKTSFIQKISVIAGTILSGFCWYISNGLNGNYWYLLWIAPIPVILISLNSSGKKAFLISFLAYLIGRLSWFGYLVTVASLIPAIIFTIALPLVFAIIMVLTRRMIIKTNSWNAVFAFPVFFTAFEWLLINFSSDGTAASIAYSQSNFLPLIQIASITGIIGITFIVTFIPSVVAIGWHFRREKTKILPLIAIAFIVIGPVFIYGFSRINPVSKKDTVTVGLVVLDEKTHKMGNLNFQDELRHTKNYASEISKLAARGAKLIVLPERAININKETDSTTIGILSSCAKTNHVGIVTGYTNFKNEIKHNSALAIDQQGNVVMDYNKIHLVKGLEDEFVPGKKLGLFAYKNLQLGAPICKDLDFPAYIKQYGSNKVTFLCIPAWDFIVDDWLHSRMAILRGVENGFSEVRTARLGRLTISDYFGRVNAEVNSSNEKATSLVGQVSLDRIDTFYTRHGDWFGITVIIATITFLFLSLVKRKAPQPPKL
ncbi:MAG TPA: nitrilase-related carbon-nitrogen hydrolase [Hanamia sp.]|nr:nitrilase-related carbon-nitrogen hydrolase [Hanamia sp.]